jgi:hypothetical protein
MAKKIRAKSQSRKENGCKLGGFAPLREIHSAKAL